MGTDGLSKELFRIGSRNGLGQVEDVLEQGCRATGVLGFAERLVAVIDEGGWIRKGSESYCAVATIQYKMQDDTIRNRKIIAKAYVGLGLPPDRVVTFWQDRAWNLSAAGVGACTVYGICDGTLYCEYVQHGLIEWLKASPGEKTAVWAGRQLSNLVRKLDDLGVHALSLLWDLRTNGELISIVDFGEDLGPVPGPLKGEVRCRDLMIRELEQAGLRKVSQQM